MVKTFGDFRFTFFQLTQHLREKKVEFGARQRENAGKDGKQILKVKCS